MGRLYFRPVMQKRFPLLLDHDTTERASMKQILLVFMLIFSFGIAWAQTDEGHSFKNQYGQNRVALVIGNAEYEGTLRLRNPKNDARAMEEILKTKGFEVDLVLNAELDAMTNAIERFSTKLTKNTIGLFYYAGHAVEFKGTNYLIPLNDGIRKEGDFKRKAVSVQEDVLGEFAYSEDSGTNIVILDACRENPFKTRSWFKKSRGMSSRGLARIKEPPRGTLIAYAAAPGQAAEDGDGNNGVFTKHLLHFINEPGITINEMFIHVRQAVYEETVGEQLPAVEDLLLGKFYFTPTQSIIPTTMIPPSTSGSIRPPPDLVMWEQIENSQVKEDFEFFMSEYPNSPYLPTARLKLMQLERQQQTSTTTIMTTTSTSTTAPQYETRSADGRYIDKGNGVIEDIRTGLMWTKKDSYADLGECLNWNASERYVAGLRPGGYSDWRLPTVEELQGIYEESKSNKTYTGSNIRLDPIFAPGGAWWYWSSEETGSCCVRGVFFSGGGVVGEDDWSYCDGGGVRAVRP